MRIVSSCQDDVRSYAAHRQSVGSSPYLIGVYGSIAAMASFGTSFAVRGERAPDRPGRNHCEATNVRIFRW